MGLIKEPQNIDFKIKSKPWTEKELSDFSTMIQELKEKGGKRKVTYPLSKQTKRKTSQQ